jgi:hypothetical protein
MWVLLGSIFMFFNFYQLDLHNENLCCMSKSLMKAAAKTELKIGLKIGPLVMIWLWLLEVHVC